MRHASWLGLASTLIVIKHYPIIISCNAHFVVYIWTLHGVLGNEVIKNKNKNEWKNWLIMLMPIRTRVDLT